MYKYSQLETVLEARLIGKIVLIDVFLYEPNGAKAILLLKKKGVGQALNGCSFCVCFNQEVNIGLSFLC